LAAQEVHLEVAAEEAIAAEALAERNYSLGVSDVFNVLDAQSRRISAEAARISARRERAANRVALHLAVGGDFLADAAPTPLSAGDEPET
ncbi:MAG: TolC family protein, partial [Caulobacterales bacterium]|nr:TolC family protein [Caulobacterales bacterium]